MPLYNELITIHTSRKEGQWPRKSLPSPNSEKSIKEAIKAKLREAQSLDEVKTIAAENSKELTDDEAQHLFDMFHDENPSTGKLSDEELDSVTGAITWAN